MTDLPAPEEIFFVLLHPRPYMAPCYRRFTHKDGEICSVCNDTGEYKRNPGKHSKSATDRLYATRRGMTSLLASHAKCCDINVYQALPDWQIIQENIDG